MTPQAMPSATRAGAFKLWRPYRFRGRRAAGAAGNPQPLPEGETPRICQRTYVRAFSPVILSGAVPRGGRGRGPVRKNPRPGRSALRPLRGRSGYFPEGGRKLIGADPDNGTGAGETGLRLPVLFRGAARGRYPNPLISAFHFPFLSLTSGAVPRILLL